MSFLAELKRRNVFRVGIAYAITAWLLIQVADILLEAIGAPPWVMQTLFVVLGIGMVIALLFAWAFELTPEGVKRESEVDRSQSITPQTGQKLNRTIITILVLALGYFVIDKFYLSAPGPAQTVADANLTPETVEKSTRTIAVLPFVDMSQNGDNEYFSDGLTEELLNILAKIKELRVAGRTSSFAFKDKNIEEAERIEPYSVEVLWNLMSFNAFTGQPEKTLPYAERTAELQPGNPNQYWGPAMAYQLNGQLVRAMDYQLKANQADPNDYELMAGIASIWLALGDLQQAEYWMNLADKTGADQPTPTAIRVTLYQYREQYGLAADLGLRNRWHNLLFGNIAFNELHDDAEFKNLVAMIEEDMAQQLEKVYQLPGVLR